MESYIFCWFVEIIPELNESKKTNVGLTEKKKIDQRQQYVWVINFQADVQTLKRIFFKIKIINK